MTMKMPRDEAWPVHAAAPIAQGSTIMQGHGLWVTLHAARAARIGAMRPAMGGHVVVVAVMGAMMRAGADRQARPGRKNEQRGRKGGQRGEAEKRKGHVHLRHERFCVSML